MALSIASGMNNSAIPLFSCLIGTIGNVSKSNEVNSFLSIIAPLFFGKQQFFTLVVGWYINWPFLRDARYRGIQFLFWIVGPNSVSGLCVTATAIVGDVVLESGEKHDGLWLHRETLTWWQQDEYGWNYKTFSSMFGIGKGWTLNAKNFCRRSGQNHLRKYRFE